MSDIREARLLKANALVSKGFASYAESFSVSHHTNFLIEKFNSLIQEFENKDIPRPENWGGFIVNPVEYEFWQGGENRLHDRIRYKLVNNLWKIDRLSP